MSEHLKKLLADLQARQQANRTPKSILVSGKLFGEMNDAGMIQKKISTFWGLPLGEDWQTELPYNGDTCVLVDPFLDSEGTPYRLPPRP